MTNRRKFPYLVACLLPLLLQLANCSGNPTINVHVNITSPTKPQTIEAGQTVPITATVVNDTSGLGVSWSINPAAGAGTFLVPTTPASATYQSPVGINAATPATVIATSIADPNKSAGLLITVEPAVSIPSTTLPAATITVAYTATVNATGGLAPYTWALAPGSNPLPAWAKLGNSATNSVTITGTPNAIGTTNFTLQITDSLGVTAISPALSLVVNAIPALQITTASPLNPPAIAGTKYSLTFAATGGIAPYKWSVANGSTLPPNLGLTNAGVLSGMPTTAGNPSFSITVTDSENPAVSSTSPFTLLIQPAGTLQITSSATLPDAIVNQAYSTTLQASGGTAPYTWSLQAGSTLPAGLTLSSGGVISGTPTAAGPPANTFTIVVTDSANPAGTAQTTFSLLVNAQAALSGSYAFEFNGYQIANVGGVSVNQRVTAAGSFVIGAGSAITGIEDYNTGGGQNFTGQSFTGQFSAAGGRGTLTLNGLKQGTTVYSFALDSTGAVGRLIETDSTTGARGSGEIAKQGATTCTDATLKGDYVFGLTGDSTAQNGFSLFGPSVFAGRFTTDGVGGIFNGEADEHSPNQIIHINLGSLNGTYKQGSNPGFCAISMTAGTLTSTLNVYPVTTNTSGVITEAYLIAADPLNTTNFYILEGKLVQQPGSQLGAGPPFTGSAALDGASVAGLTGQLSIDGGQTYVPDDYIAQFVGSGNSFSMNITENQNGVVATATPTTNPPSPSGTFSMDSFGWAQFSAGNGFVMYVIDTDRAFFMTTNTSNGIDPVFGEFDSQFSGPNNAQGPYTAATVSTSAVNASPLPMGTLTPSTTGAPEYDGIVTLDGVKNVGGTQDTNTKTGSSFGQTIVGTYTNINSSTGFGNYAQTGPSNLTGVFFIVSPTKLVVLTTTANDLNPVVFVIGQ